MYTGWTTGELPLEGEVSVAGDFLCDWLWAARQSERFAWDCLVFFLSVSFHRHSTHINPYRTNVENGVSS